MDRDRLYVMLKRLGKNKSWLADQLGIRPSTVWGWKDGESKYELAMRWLDAELRLQAYDRIENAIKVLK